MQVFEHECLYVAAEGKGISADQLEALQRFFKPKDFPYYKLINNGVQFCQYVGVLQVGSLTIEVLPKVERKTQPESKLHWQQALISMLQLSGIFNSDAPSSSLLSLKPNSVLDLYFRLFIKEVETLMHKGLVKRYCAHEGNKKALKGKLLFAMNIQQNLVHRERFYVQYTAYTKDHTVNRILYKTLKVLASINTNATLSGRIGAMLLDFPEMKDMNVSDATFDRLHIDRKTEDYRTALAIARLILLNYHPDITKGRTDVLALMFDMNYLWERFVLASIRKHSPRNTKVHEQNGRHFWRKLPRGRFGKMYADIFIELADGRKVVLDTKWKNFDDYKPGPEDLRQMYVYQDYYIANKVSLVYPSVGVTPIRGLFALPGKKEDSEKECSLLPLLVNKNVKKWQRDIYNNVLDWINQ